MKLLTKNTDYAVRALLWMAEKGGSVTVTELSDTVKIGRPMLRKLLQVLAHKGLLDSSKGRGGGFRLAIPPEKIRLTNLIDIFQGAVELSDCVVRKEVCPEIRCCPLRREIEDIRGIVEQRLGKLSIGSLLAQRIKKEEVNDKLSG